MSHESVITDLKKLLKQAMMSIPPKAYAEHLFGESDRATIILSSAGLEETVLHRLKRLMPSLNSEERERIFNFEGPCGSFSNRIRLAQGLGVINRPMRKRIEIIKEMRNVAAHSFARITFEVPQIRNATAALYDPKDRKLILNVERGGVRGLFITACVNISASLVSDDPYDPSKIVARLIQRGTAKPQTSPEKS